LKNNIIGAVASYSLQDREGGPENLSHGPVACCKLLLLKPRDSTREGSLKSTIQALHNSGEEGRQGLARESNKTAVGEGSSDQLHGEELSRAWRVKVREPVLGLQGPHVLAKECSPSCAIL
jgi:hypothetical protein